jgi:hypothetical protein
LVREHLEKLEGRNSALGHGQSLNLWLNPSPKNRGSQVYNSPSHDYLPHEMCMNCNFTVRKRTP